MAITISRLLTVKNGFVRVPRGEISKSSTLRVKDVLDAISGSRVIQVGPNGKRYTLMNAVSAGTDTESWGLFDYPRYDFYIELPSNDVRSSTSADDDFGAIYDLAS